MNWVSIVSIILLSIIFSYKINYFVCSIKDCENIKQTTVFKTKFGWIIGLLLLVSGIFVNLKTDYNFAGIKFADIIFTLLIMAIIDFKFRIIPNELNISLLLSQLIIVCFLEKATLSLVYIIVFVITLIVLTVISKLTGEQVGMGDVKLLSIITLFFGIGFLAYTMLFSMIIMLLFALPFLLLKKMSLKTQLPFVPFYVLGVIIFYIIN